ELAVTYATLILADAEIEITADKILAITDAADVEVEPIWATLLAKALEGKDVKELLLNVGGPGEGTGGISPASGNAAIGQVTGEELKGEEKEEESDDESEYGGMVSVIKCHYLFFRRFGPSIVIEVGGDLC
ncbi:hypothetical protein K474DRAFT_246830, partial [Panus rudis PR-1116 ss-1]